MEKEIMSSNQFSLEAAWWAAMDSVDSEATVFGEAEWLGKAVSKAGGEGLFDENVSEFIELSIARPAKFWIWYLPRWWFSLLKWWLSVLFWWLSLLIWWPSVLKRWPWVLKWLFSPPRWTEDSSESSSSMGKRNKWLVDHIFGLYDPSLPLHK